MSVISGELDVSEPALTLTICTGKVILYDGEKYV